MLRETSSAEYVRSRPVRWAARRTSQSEIWSLSEVSDDCGPVMTYVMRPVYWFEASSAAFATRSAMVWSIAWVPAGSAARAAVNFAASYSTVPSRVIVIPISDGDRPLTGAVAAVSTLDLNKWQTTPSGHGYPVG